MLNLIYFKDENTSKQWNILVATHTPDNVEMAQRKKHIYTRKKSALEKSENQNLNIAAALTNCISDINNDDN